MGHAATSGNKQCCHLSNYSETNSAFPIDDESLKAIICVYQSVVYLL